MIRHNFRQLVIWQDAVTLAKEIYNLTQTFPSEHKFGLSSQIFRATVSISSNIAEGSAKASEKDFAYYLSTSLGSAFELETQLLIAKQCCIVKADVVDGLIIKVHTLQKRIISFTNLLKTGSKV